MRLRWALTGRSEELRLVDAALDDPESSGIVVRGAAGVGKTRLAREALDGARSRGWQSRWLGGTLSARTIPLGAMSDWIGPAVANDLEVVRTVIDSLMSAAAGAPVVVCIDDVGLLDDLSTFVVHQIVRRGTAKVVMTVRDGPSVGAATQEVWKDGNFEQLELQPLSREEVARLVSNALGGRLVRDAVERLWRLTRGNVLYLRNIVEHEVACGRLAQQGGEWRWVGEPVIPPGLVEMIEVRLGDMSDAVSDAVDVLAVAEPLDLATLTGIIGSASVEAADVRGLISVDDQSRVHLAHPLYGEVRRARAAPTRLRRLRGLVATQLGSIEGAEDVQSVVRRAALGVESDLAPDPELLTAAAQGALSLADMPLADRLADAAIRDGAGADAYFTRSLALAWSNPEAADAVLASVPRERLSEEDDVLRACHRTGVLMWGLADPEGAKRVIDEAAQRDSAPHRDWVEALYIIYWATMAKPATALRSAPCVVLDELPAQLAAMTSLSMGLAYGDTGRITDALSTFEVGYRMVARKLLAPHVRYAIGDRHVGALLQAGTIPEAERLAEQMCLHSTDLPGAAPLLTAAIAGRVALGAGRIDDAHALLAPAIEAFFATGDVNGFGYRYQILDTMALAMTGADEECAAALAHLEQHHYASYGFVDYERNLARAWVAANQGILTEAIAHCLAGANKARENGQFAAEVMCLQTATQFGDRSCGDRLLELTAVVEGPRVALAARLAAALSAGDALATAAVSEGFEAIGELVAAVDAAAHAARLYRQQERRGSALGCSTRAEALAARCGLTTPALRQASERLPLTDRQREIVMLIGQQLSTAAIAERLTLSRRTVESHIYRAMAKTGVATREQLAALIPQRKTSA
jgi:DNA-binding CsgD family transcriptional regulator